LGNYSDYIRKSNPPKVQGIVPRTRVFAQLDRCLEAPVAWVSGPAGSGKTALVASYLHDQQLSCVWYKMDGSDADPATFFSRLGRALQALLPAGANSFPVLTSEYLHGLDVFASRFFEQMLAAPEIPRLLVVDNYHEVPQDAEIHLVLAKSFARLPVELSFIILSRELPLPKYARLRAGKQLAVLNPDSLKLTLEEARSVIGYLAPECPEQLRAFFHEHTMGWAAGLVLMVEHYRLTQGREIVPDIRTPQEILDYFASELFEGASTGHQDFLLKTSAFHEMTAGMARELTGLQSSDQILSTLNRRHFFTDLFPGSDPVYLYHPLFLEFLRSRAESSLGRDGFREIQRAAAHIAERHGLGAAAADLYVSSRDWPGLTLLLEKMAVNVIAQGFTKQLIAWLDQVPQEVLHRHPRLLYWLGISELSLAGCTQARARFELALRLSDAEGAGEGVYLAWSALVDSYFFEMNDWHPLDHWLFALGDFQKRYPEIPTGTTGLRVALSGFTAHVLRCSPPEQITPWQERLASLLPQTDFATRLQAGVVTSLRHVWTGDYHQNRLLLDQLRGELRHAVNPPPLPVLTLKFLEALHGFLTVEPGPCRAAISDGLALASSSGVYVWNHHFLFCAVEIALIEGDCGEARSLLRDLGQDLGAANSLVRFYYHLLSAWVDFLQDDTASALSHLEVGHGPAMTIGSPLYEGIWSLAMAQVKLRRKAYEEAPRFIERALTLSRQTGSRNLEFLSLLYQAQMLCELGYTDDALLALESGLQIGRDQNYLHFVWWIPAVLADLCALALRHGIETEYVRQLIRRRKLFPALAPVDIEEWPWEVTIHSLGKLEILVHGELLKIQKKPLELLKTIITLGGCDVKYERIADLLWPDAEGDSGLGNFKITLHRLRQLLGESSLSFKDGKLSLDTRRVWLDVWSYERTALKASAEWCKSGDPGETLALTERAWSLYRGQFIADDLEQGWLYPQREKLSRSYIAIVAYLGERYLSAGNVEQAIALYEKAVELEPLAELLYEGLIKAYNSAGFRTHATQTYRRYESSLWENLRVQPAKRLTQLVAYAAI
jgi:LuxR family transcriptional regulator, maltose regulon positive regulatory protein